MPSYASCFLVSPARTVSLFDWIYYQSDSKYQNNPRFAWVHQLQIGALLISHPIQCFFSSSQHEWCLVNDNLIMFSPGYYPTKQQQLMVMSYVSTIHFLFHGLSSLDGRCHWRTRLIGLDWIVQTILIFQISCSDGKSKTLSHMKLLSSIYEFNLFKYIHSLSSFFPLQQTKRLWVNFWISRM